MPAKTPVSKAKAAKPSTAKATPKSPSLDLSDDAGSIASSKKQLQFKSTPAAKAAGASASARKRPLAIKEEEEPVAKKGKTPSKVGAHANFKKIHKQCAISPIHLPPALSPQDKPSWKELEAQAAAERASAAKSSSMKLVNPKARSPKQLLMEEARSAQTKNTPSPRMTRGQRATAVSAKKPSPAAKKEVPAKAASTTKKGASTRRYVTLHTDKYQVYANIYDISIFVKASTIIVAVILRRIYTSRCAMCMIVCA